MLPPSFEGRQRSLPQRVQRHPQSKEMRMPSNTQCHLKVEMQYKTGKLVVLHQDENSPTSEIAHVRSHWLFFSVASSRAAMPGGSHHGPKSESYKTITWGTRMIPKLPTTPLQSPSAFHHLIPKLASLQTLRTQLQFQVGGNPKRHVLVALFSVGMKVSVAWGISLCGRSGDFVSWDQFQRPSEFAKCRAHSLELTCRFDGFLGGGGVWLEITKFDGLKQNRFNRIDNEIIMKYESVSGLFWKHRQCNKVDRSTRAKQTFTVPCSC